MEYFVKAGFMDSSLTPISSARPSVAWYLFATYPIVTYLNATEVNIT